VTYLVAYLSALVVFGIIDAGWLSTMGNLIYRPLLGDLLAPSVRIAPAIAFYLLYPVGITVFAALPAIRSGSLSTALILGLLFGAIAYGTYDLTNQATLRIWPVQITLIDIAYGAVASGLAAMAAFAVTRWLVGSSS
jgi:uncharacterized membrane protein